MKNSDFLTIEALHLKVGLSIQRNELMKQNEYQRSSSFFQNQNLFIPETVRSFESKFHMKDYVSLEIIIQTN